MVELVHVGAEGPWSDLATTSSCEELSNSSWSQPPDTDQEDALVLDMQVVDDDEELQSSQHDARPFLEVMASAWPRTEPSHPYQPPQITEARGEWYEGEECFDPGQIAPPASPQLVPSPDGGLNWGGNEAIPPFRTNRPPFRGRSIQRVFYYSRTNPGANGKRPKMSGEARQDRCGLASTHFQREVFWQQAVWDYQYYPAADYSPINFLPPEGYRESLKAVPYSLLVPLALEVPYLDGLAQEALSDQLIPASLYGLTVLRLAYTVEAVGPKSITATKTVVDSGRAYTNYIIDGDVEAHQDHDCYVGRSPQCETEGVFTCSHPGCMGVEGFGAYFASTEQFVAHWNTFHVAISVGYNCPEVGCHHCSAPGPDALDRFLRHIRDQHSTVWQCGQGERLPTVVKQAQFTGNNPMYWPVPPEGGTPPTARLCGVLPPTAAQMENPIIAARWAVRAALMKEIRAKLTSLARKERKSKRHGNSLDHGSSGGKKSRNGPSPPTYAAAVKGWAAQGAGQDGQRPSTSGSSRKSRASDRHASLRRSPRRNTWRDGSKSSSRPTSRNRRDTSSGSDTASSSSQRGCSSATRARGRGRRSLGALLGIGRGHGSMPPPRNPPRATGLASQLTKLAGEATWAEGAPQPMELGQDNSCSDSTSEQGPRPFGGHRPGEGPVPPRVDTVVLLSGEQVYKGTPEQLILVYENCKTENNGQNWKLAIWCFKQVENERERMKAKVLLHLIETPQLAELPHLPDWAAPNGWDFWGRPWAYMDAPSGHSKVGVTSEAGRARVTVAVLVWLDRDNIQCRRYAHAEDPRL